MQWPMVMIRRLYDYKKNDNSLAQEDIKAVMSYDEKKVIHTHNTLI